jgi:DNA-binding transcriptional ArsR family regulator
MQPGGCQTREVTDVFFAISDPIRRRLLERLFAENGQTWRELRAGVAITRQGITKHLDVLEAAGLVVGKRVAREKLYFISSAPLVALSDGWLARFRPAGKPAAHASVPKAPPPEPAARGAKRKDERRNHLSRKERMLRAMTPEERAMNARFAKRDEPG